MTSAAPHLAGLDPFPQGWYVIEASDRLGRNQHISKTWMGREIIAWRDESGSLCVADAFCPHLGAHLGPEAGGLLRGNKLVCPFHGFEYDVSGACVKAAAGPAPPTAKLRRYPIQEVNGYIFAYYDPQGREPEWFLPDVCQDGWAGRAITIRRIRSHPQITSENSVDFAHFGHLHGYDNVKQLRPTEIDGPFLTAYYQFDRHMILRALRFVVFHVEIEVCVWGLGVSRVLVKSLDNGMVVQQWVLATPVDGNEIDVWLAGEFKTLPQVYGLHKLPKAVTQPLLARLFVRGLAAEVNFDEVVWARQRYQPKPVLCQADRDIFRYRRYCEQFYPHTREEPLRVLAG